ncbi:acyl-CoA thioesterase domain-containing protein [Brevibacterium sp.]|jgi:acyl-CoA thioesterase-2|uniref:acyl-CoA thioesterase n=1 Tax=Brevibacterium sp. TaxID=1701 RepID=UPI0025BF07A4|nr:acyl-CoA thioesterase domain-containing protein [Brevibacterium sp.]
MTEVGFTRLDPLEGSFVEMMELERIDPNIYRAGYVFEEPYALYGGQVAAQSLRAAGLTVDADRRPHSLHGYFLRPGDASQPTVLQVHRDRDGRSFSARRVVALQNGKVIFNMSCSFAAPFDSPEHSEHMPVEEAPMGTTSALPRMFGFEARLTEQVYESRDYPLRFWARCTEDLGDPAEDQLMHLCALTYLSDISSGVGAWNTAEYRSGSSLDHAVWFRQDVDMNSWVLMDLHPESVSRGRGLYRGRLGTESGEQVATIAQETLFRPVH